MIITKITGGLGNQLFQYAVGRAVADYHKIPLKLDISIYETYGLHNGFRLDQFNCKIDIATNKEIKRKKGQKNIIGWLLRASGLLKTYYKEKQRNILDLKVFERPSLYLDGYWQNEKYFLDIRDQLRKELQPKHPLSSVASVYEQEIKDNCSVSVHVRRGDYLDHAHIGALEVSYYRSAVFTIASKVQSPRFYIFSDDPDWCRQNLNFIENAVFVADTASEIDDFMLMMYCKHNIIANSSFSWWAAWLNNSPEKIVTAPEKWLATSSPGCKWAADGWIEL
jgi:hypothetical protein